MNKLGITCKLGILSFCGVAMAVGIAALAHSPAHARPTPECGPTCNKVLFEGTICEKTQFEKESGRVCSPA